MDIYRDTLNFLRPGLRPGQTEFVYLVTSVTALESTFWIAGSST